MKPMDQDERVVAQALVKFLHDGDDVIPLGASRATEGKFLAMTMHRVGHTFAHDRFVIARVTNGDEAVEYEVEIVARRKS